MAFGLVLIVALLAAHTATAARTIDAGVQSDVTRTVTHTHCSLPGGENCLLLGRLCLGRQPYLLRLQPRPTALLQADTSTVWKCIQAIRVQAQVQPMV